MLPAVPDHSGALPSDQEPWGAFLYNGTEITKCKKAQPSLLARKRLALPLLLHPELHPEEVLRVSQEGYRVGCELREPDPAGRVLR